MKKLTPALWILVIAAATPTFGAIVYSGSQNVVLSLNPMSPMDAVMIDLAGMGGAGAWDDFKVSLWLEMGMSGELPPSPAIGTGMGTKLAIYAPRGMGMSMGTGGVLGMAAVGTEPQLPYASNLPLGGLIGPNSSSFFDMAYLYGSGEFGEDGGYVGLRTGLGHYGWLHVLSQANLGTNTHSVVLDGWAYEDQPGVPIGAGETGDCDWRRGNPHKMHWPQLPDLSPTGIDISLGRAVLADDFKCTATGPIRDIHIWGSFLNDVLPEHGPDALTFELRIYTDVPATATSWSRPGDLKWRKAFKPGEYTYRRVHNGPEDWYDPANGVYLPGNHRYAFQYNFCIDDGAFEQEEGKIYWLAVKDLSANPSNYTFGWKTTSPPYHWNDDAAYLVDGAAWIEMKYPKGHEYEGHTLDLAFVITDGETTPVRDLGDAPDSSNSVAGADMLAYPSGVAAHYPTVYHAGSPPYGPLHLRPRAMFYLGKEVSLENEADVGPDEDAVNNLEPAADVANQDGADDGLARPLSLPFCQKTTLDYIVTVADPAAASAYVNVWCDWNRDGDWSDTLTCPDGEVVPEWAVQNDTPAFPGVGTYVFTSSPFQCWHPTTDGLDPIWVRITISEQRWTAPTSAAASGGAGPVGGYRYGETEDYYIQPEAEPVPPRYDWGDAPDGLTAPGYPVLAAHNGARHVIAGPWLGGRDHVVSRGDEADSWHLNSQGGGFSDGGDNPDAEEDGQPDARARGDDDNLRDDEDGVSVQPMTAGLSAAATLKVRGGGVVQVWIDFDGDKMWEQAEKIFDAYRQEGVHVIWLSVPHDAVPGRTFLRARISTGGGLTPDGPAGDGEVEDHEVEIVTPVEREKTWCQFPDLTPHGIDIRLDKSDNRPRAIADDFECRSPGQLTHVRLWGSWKDDRKGVIRRLRVRIHPDDPIGPEGADQENNYSKPGPEILWEKEFVTGQFEESLHHTVRIDGEWWWDPVSGAPAIPGGDTQVWQIDMDVKPEEAFVQQGTADKPRIYWLAIEAETVEGQFGWKTRQWPEHFMDDAVWDVSTTLPRTWYELHYPAGHRFFEHEYNSIDMAFCLLFQTGTTPQPTSQPVAVTQCPPVETTCPALLTTCPAVETECPSAPTKCPVVATQCPPVLTKCPPTPTQCQVGQTICPAVETRCPVVETQCPPVSTKCPESLTKCPPTATECQVVETQCPVVETKCPPVQTKCPESPTKCPPTATLCQAIDTQCPVVETRCPPVQTKCPPTSTKCPEVLTRCPPTPTQCQTGDTQCPIVETRCPPIETKCPPESTKCPESLTKCPPVITRCPPTATECQVVETECPVIQTKCPPVQTECPPVSTECPSILTKCPPTLSRCRVIETQCPTVETKCPPVETECPVVSTECPPALTKCPVTPTVCVTVQTQCPAVQTKCPPVDTQCPTVLTECPPTVTRCPMVKTQCPLCINLTAPGTDPVSDARLTVSCPTVETLCPTARDYVAWTAAAP